MPSVARVVGVLVGVGLGLVGVPVEAAPPESASAQNEAELIVWSGGKTREEAERQQEGLKDYLSALSPVLQAKPAVLESSKVEGLKPGFFIVTLGLCSKDKVKEPLSLFQAIYPDVYTRTVKYQPGEDLPVLECPQAEEVTEDDSGRPVLWRLKGAQRVTQKGKALAGLAFTYEWDQAGDFARSYFTVKGVYLLIDSKTRQLVESKVYDGPSDATTLTSFTSEKERLVTELDYADPPCSPSGDAFEAWEARVVVSIRKDHIELVQGKPKLTKQGSCGYAEESRMITGEGRGDDSSTESQ
ncbi:hypothetical protein [Hyalangium versicolor]|uniref:hypothetical protein n=1 Tax=Hyalangium versicolor TaxID=2861190 RepID=UPI001CCB2ADB|nr:hypothetical protein [Hyalangium versicolor]